MAKTTTHLTRKQPAVSEPYSLPGYARSAINRCNLPAVILGSLTFQANPSSLSVDSATDLHRQLFNALNTINSVEERALHFQQYMRSAFLLGQKDQAGFDPHSASPKRHKADYLRLLRGWMFNADSIEAAVLKRWVESRFGLLTRNHHGTLSDFSSEAYAAYQADVARGLYNTNALEAQLDVLYTFCQYELSRRFSDNRHWTLFRGFNHLEDHEVLDQQSKHHCTLLLNNLNSFSSDRHQSDTFGDHVLECSVPYSKIFYFPDMLPGLMQGEGEFMVIGGVYACKLL